MPSLARRVHSTTDLTALRRFENRVDQRDECESTIWDYDDGSLGTAHTATASNASSAGLSALVLELQDKDLSEFVDTDLPEFDRTKSSSGTYATYTDKAPAELEIDVDVGVPTFVADSMQTLSGVRIPLIPERAVSSIALDKERLSEGAGNSPDLSARLAVRRTRTLPPFVKHLSPMEKKLSERILTDDAWMMRSKAKANARILRGETNDSKKLSRGRSTSALSGMGAQSSSLSDLFLEMLGRPVKHDTETWYDKLNKKAGGQNGAQNGSQLNLSVMAWDSVHVLPGQAVAPNEHCKVVTVKGDAGAETREERSIQIVLRPTDVAETWSRFEYDRTPGQPPQFTMEDLQQMRNEMISYKITEMDVHPESRQNTHIYRPEISR
ncbi:hypothetical protein SARC_06063 [Sphaeroforma arctica JP610]|uniref:Uncharacterized protein n=1 Tax=Sphaeroforma arctica JP610 TaxID=667725 RepID=A0A0L0FXS3_9EUKA|nr:hypothetical protein SARC_06063 [Sphaeroforma arctica JP610]KNC81625.1 hypothetical protein SARC_06063 [Sphaeroforma arctica JP610]|eukprot:XP_014155527.1 hypothetical protein SARC_06063 [Sphaeroforma arctica JP610]